MRFGSSLEDIPRPSRGWTPLPRLWPRGVHRGHPSLRKLGPLSITKRLVFGFLRMKTQYCVDHAKRRAMPDSPVFVNTYPVGSPEWRWLEGYGDMKESSELSSLSEDSLKRNHPDKIVRLSAACVLAEELEGRLARGEEIDIERHALLCSTLTRLAQRIGIDRRAKNIMPSLGDYLRSPPPAEIDGAAE